MTNSHYRICAFATLLLLMWGGVAAAQSRTLETLFPCSEKLDNSVGVSVGITRRSEDFNDRDKVVQDLVEMGIRSMRTGIYWDTFVRRGSLNYELTDPAMEATRNSKLELTNYLTYNNDATVNAFLKPADFADYVGKAVARYRFYCLDWQVFPNVEFLSVNKKKITPDLYFSALRNASRAVKSVGKDFRVIMGGLEGIGKPFVDSLLSYGALNYADVMYFNHFSTPELVVRKLTDLRSSMDKYAGKTAPVWCGYTFTSNPDKEEEQAMNLPRFYLLAFSCGVDKVYWEGYRSQEKNEKNRSHFSGLTHADFTPKPAYYAMETLMKMLPNHCSRPVVTVRNQVYLAKWLDMEGKPVWAVWCPSVRDVSLKIEGKPRFTGYDGKKLKFKSITEAGPSLVYIQGAKNVSFE